MCSHVSSMSMYIYIYPKYPPIFMYPSLATYIPIHLHIATWLVPSSLMSLLRCYILSKVHPSHSI